MMTARANVLRPMDANTRNGRNEVAPMLRRLCGLCDLCVLSRRLLTPPILPTPSGRSAPSGWTKKQRKGRNGRKAQ